MFQKKNANPERNIGKADCAFRAIAIAEGRSWDDVFKSLSWVGLQVAENSQAEGVWRAYMDYRKYSHTAFPRLKRGKHRMSLEDFTQKYPEGAYVLLLDNKYQIRYRRSGWYKL